MSILVIDVGSSSVRALLLDEDANPIPEAIARRSHDIISTPDGGAYFEVQPLQTRIEACLDEILQHPLAKTIQAVGMDTFVGNVLGVDGDNHPLTSLFTYAETRPKQILEDLRPFYNQSDTWQRTGCPHHTAYYPSQLAWLKQTQVAQWLDLGTFLYRNWFGGDVPMSYSVASWSGLLHRRDLVWDQIWLEYLGFESNQFPPLADYSATQQGLSRDYAERWPILANIPFYLAVGDGAAANIGVCAVDESSIALTLGTTGAMRIVTSAENPPVPKGLWAYRVDAKHHLIGGATSEGGNVYQWITQTFQLPDDAEAQIKGRERGSHGLKFIPSLAGERSPSWNPDARGAIEGLRLGTTPLDILQAALEGIAERLNSIFQALPKNDPITIRASGGALTQSPLWTRIIAETLGHPLELVQIPEATASGTAKLVLAHLQSRALTDFPLPPMELHGI